MSNQLTVYRVPKEILIIVLAISVVATVIAVASYTVSEQFNVNRFGKCKNEVIDSWSPVKPCDFVTDELGKVPKNVVPSNFVNYRMSGSKPTSDSIVALESATHSNFTVTPIASANSKQYSSANAVLHSMEPVNELPFVMDTNKRFYLDSRKEFCKVSKDNASMGCAGQIRSTSEGFEDTYEGDTYEKEYSKALNSFDMPLTLHNNNTSSFYPIYPYASMGTDTVTGDKYYLGFPNNSSDGMSFVPYLQK